MAQKKSSGQKSHERRSAELEGKVPHGCVQKRRKAGDSFSQAMDYCSFQKKLSKYDVPKKKKGILRKKNKSP